MTDQEVIAKWLHSQRPSPDDSCHIALTAADFMAQAGAFIASLDAAGRVIVPREPTQGMRNAANLRAAQAREKEDLKREIVREQNKVHCKECNGAGRIFTQGPLHTSSSQCWRCNGAGRHDP